MSSPTRTAAVTQRGSYSLTPLIVLILAQVGTTSDNAAMNIAVGSLTTQLGSALGDIQVANTVYALFAGALMIAGGLLGVIVGWRTTMRIGLGLAVVGELCAALAPSMTIFTWCGRLLLGVGASLIMPAVLGSVPAMYQGRRRAIAFGAIAGAAAISTLSPLVLGLLMDASGFRATFGVLALYFVVVLGSTMWLPKATRSIKRPHFDVPGMVLAVAGLGLFLLGVSQLSTWGVWAPSSRCPFTILGISPAVPMVVMGLALLAALVLFEQRTEHKRGGALIPSSFVKVSAVRAGLLAVAMPFFYMAAQGIVIMPYLQLVAGFSAMQAGMLSLLAGLPMFAMATTLPKMAPHLSSRLIIRVGFAVLAVSSLLIAIGTVPGGVGPLLFVGVCFGGFGVGAINSQSNNAVASAVEGRDAQQSGGMQGAARNVGMALGTALAGTSLLLAIGFGLTSALPADDASADARSAVLEQGSSLMSDDAFERIIEPYDLSAHEGGLFTAAEQGAQANATRLTFVLLALVMAGCLAGTRHLVETAAPPENGPASRVANRMPDTNQGAKRA